MTILRCRRHLARRPAHGPPPRGAHGSRPAL